MILFVVIILFTGIFIYLDWRITAAYKEIKTIYELMVEKQNMPKII